MESPKLGNLQGVLNSEHLRELYNETDLTFTYVSQKCLELIALKGCKITDDQVIFWFREMIQEKWTVKIFDQQFEVVKSVKRFGDTLDWQHWIQTERMYNEHELYRKIREAVNNKLNAGKGLLEVLSSEGPEALIKLSDENKEALVLRAVDEFINEVVYTRIRVAEEFVHEEKIKMRKAMSDTKKFLRTLSDDQKKGIIGLMLERGTLGGTAKDWEKDYFLADFHLFHPEIMMLEKVLSKTIFEIVKDLQ